MYHPHLMKVIFFALCASILNALEASFIEKPHCFNLSEKYSAPFIFHLPINISTAVRIQLKNCVDESTWSSCFTFGNNANSDS